MKKTFLLSLFVLALSVAAYFGSTTSETSKTVILKIGNEAREVSYKDLGVSIQEKKEKYGLSSILSLLQGTEKTDVSIDTKKLEANILELFPSLSSPEDAQASFFIRSPRQQVKKTFSLPRITEYLLAYAGNMRGGSIEIDVVPEEEAAPVPSWEELLLEKQELLTKTLTLYVEGEDVQKREWKIPLKEEGWLVKKRNGVVLSEDLLREYVAREILPLVERPVEHAYIHGFTDEEKSAYAQAEGIARDGIVVPLTANIDRIISNVDRGFFETTLELEHIPSYVLNYSSVNLGVMDLIGSGRSNFAGSPEGRSINIQKGLKEKMNNIIVPPGAEFSFNSFLGHHLSAKDGWKMALGIFGGGALLPTLGAGLCQVSTTVYRAILNSGLPIVQRKPHSLYVKYYKSYGEGLDATIYLGGSGPDLVFKNDTPSYILIQSFVDGDDAYVKFYGTSDGRKTSLFGPYRRNNIPPEMGYKPGPTEIVWSRTVHWPDNRHVEENISSRYRTLPK
ncbi:MAG: VanW family protein [Patescibacteria group bacterium]